MIEVLLDTLLSAKQALEGLDKMPMPVSFVFGTALVRINEEMKKVADLNNKFIEEHGVPNENGEMHLPGKPEQKELQKQLDDLLLNTTVTLDVSPISIKSLEEKYPDLEMHPLVISRLAFLFVE